MIHESATPPGPRQRFPGEHALAVWRDPLGSLLALAREYGDVARWRFRGTDYILLVRPEHVRQILVTDHAAFAKGRVLQEVKDLLGEGLLTSEGDVHRRQRRSIQPAFRHERVDASAEEMVAVADEVSSRWRDGQSLDVHREMAQLALSVVGRTLFRTDLDQEGDEIRKALVLVLEKQGRSVRPFARARDRLPVPNRGRHELARERLETVVGELVATRRETGAGDDDLLGVLLESSDRQARDEAMTILLTGHETMANALTWTWAQLARHADVERELHAELDDVLQGRLPTAADVPALAYTEMVFRETLRLCPPVWRIGRRALVDYKLDGYLIPAGSIIVMSPFVTQRDARFFPEPLRFEPRRWAQEEPSTRPRFSYFPFGAGPRVCIGEGFALVEGKLLLATLARRWRVRPVSGRSVRPEPLMTLRPKGGLPVTLEQR
ncbi:MAG: cytochrome P450 [Actinomycetota bacterium]|nr:cytochrome P450 [Actinomycetota bacterium]